MTEQEIIEGNKLIAKFRGFRATLVEMDIYTKEEIYKVESDTHLFADRFRINDVAIEEGFDKNNPEEYFWKVFGKKINYHSDWNLLMLVVEKIESIKIPQVAYGFEFSIKGKRCITLSKITGEDVVVIGFHNYDKKYFYTKLEATWLAVIEFIKWYNKRKEVPMK